MKKFLPLFALLATPAMAANLTKNMQGEADYTYQSAKPLPEVERCIVMSDMPDWPSVYRTPERPQESLIYYPQGATIKLEANSRGTTIRLWRRNGTSMSTNLVNCAA